MRRASLTSSIFCGQDDTTSLLVAVDLLLGKGRWDAAKAAKAWGKAALSTTARFWDSIQGITSLVSAAWTVVAGWSASLGSCMRPAGSWKCFWRTWSGARSPTPSTPSGDCHCHGRGRRSQAPGPNPLQFQRLSFPICPQELDSFFFCNQLSFTLHQSCKVGLYH